MSGLISTLRSLPKITECLDSLTVKTYGEIQSFDILSDGLGENEHRPRRRKQNTKKDSKKRSKNVGDFSCLAKRNIRGYVTNSAQFNIKNKLF